MRASFMASLIVASFFIGIIVGVAVWNVASPQGEVVTTQYTILTTTITQSTIITKEGSLSYEVCFPPGCEDRLIYWIGRANHSIHIMIYSFTLDSVGDALIIAHNRGVDVKVVFESQEINKYSEYYKLKAAGVEVRLDSNPALMHNKVAIIDDSIVITGSYNWSESAETKNNENMLIIRDRGTALIYEKEFEKIWEASLP